MVNLEASADHICSLAGNSHHAAIGSDLDGGFGTDQIPTGLDQYSNLQLMSNLLSERSYSANDIANIFYNNWLNFFVNHYLQNHG